MPSSQNYYTILQVQANAELDTIKRAYRKKMRVYHPDQFVAQLSQLKQSGSAAEVHQLEREIQRAQQMTQRINEAYAILSDTAERVAYDQHLSYERQRQYNDEVRQQRMQHWEGERRTIKSRPHHRNPNRPQAPKAEGVPWGFLVGLLVLLLFVSVLFSNAVTRNYMPFTIYVPRNPTSEGSILASELQATTNAEQATLIARSTIIFEPTATPRSSSANEALGDRFLNFGQVQRAIDAYSDAIESDADNAVLYIKRASAYTLLYDEGDTAVLGFALLDYAQAITIDATLADAYLGRGMFYYRLWLVDADYAAAARSDLEQYLDLSPKANDLAIQVILDELP